MTFYFVGQHESPWICSGCDALLQLPYLGVCGNLFTLIALDWPLWVLNPLTSDGFSVGICVSVTYRGKPILM